MDVESRRELVNSASWSFWPLEAGAMTRAGAAPNLTLDPGVSHQNMAAFIAQTARGDIPQTGTEFLTIFAVGTTLFVMTLILNAISIGFVRRFRQVYE